MNKKARLICGLFVAASSLIFVASTKAVRVLSYATESGERTAISMVGFSCVSPTIEPTEGDIERMIDDCVRQTLGAEGFAALCSTGDRVLIKVNMVGPHRGIDGEKGKAIITDPRVVKVIAARVRKAIGDEGSIVVTDTLFYEDEDPSHKKEATSFYRTGYDEDGNGILDGDARATLVNAEAYGKDRRFETVVAEPTLGKVSIWLPDFMRTRDNPSPSGEWSDVIVYVPTFKSHGFTGITGALKLGYGLRTGSSLPGDSGRADHSGYGWGTGNKQLLIEYLCAQLRARTCDFAIVDALTANRKGPLNGSEIRIRKRTDWIRTNAILASRDPVALDTSLTLLAGYDLASIGLLRAGAADGLGEDRPSHISIAGGDAFYTHRKSLFDVYAPRDKSGKRDVSGKKDGSWPLEDGWGGAKTRVDIDSPRVTSLTLTPRDGEYLIEYEIEDTGEHGSALARVELVRGDSVIATRTGSEARGSFRLADTADTRLNAASMRLVAWDNSLNATIVSIPFAREE